MAEVADMRMGNIGERGCRRRRLGGYLWSIVALVALGWMLASRSPRALLFVLVVPIALAAVGFLQAREQTCVVHAMLGTRETDQGVVRLEAQDAPEVRRRSRRVMWESMAWAIGITAAIYLAAIWNLE